MEWTSTQNLNFWRKGRIAGQPVCSPPSVYSHFNNRAAVGIYYHALWNIMHIHTQGYKNSVKAMLNQYHDHSREP